MTYDFFESGVSLLLELLKARAMTKHIVLNIVLKIGYRWHSILKEGVEDQFLRENDQTGPLYAMIDVLQMTYVGRTCPLTDEVYYPNS